MILSSPFGFTAEISFLESNYMNSFGFPHLLSHYLFLILSSIPNLALVHLCFLHRLSVWNPNSAPFISLFIFISFLISSYFLSSHLFSNKTKFQKKKTTLCLHSLVIYSSHSALHQDLLAKYQLPLLSFCHTESNCMHSLSFLHLFTPYFFVIFSTFTHIRY